MHAAKGRLVGSDYVGLFGWASDRIALVPLSTSRGTIAKFREVLGVEVLPTGMCGSDFIGIFVAGNSKGVVVPAMAEDYEIAALKKAGLNVHICPDDRTALGNNLLVNDRAGIANPRMDPAEVKKIGDALGIEMVQQPISDLPTVGAVCVVTNRGLLAYNNIKPAQLKELEILFGVRGAIGTACMGVPFTHLCIIANSHGFIAGEGTSGFETGRIDEALGFLER